LTPTGNRNADTPTRRNADTPTNRRAAASQNGLRYATRRRRVSLCFKNKRGGVAKIRRPFWNKSRRPYRRNGATV